ncbi:hypothetical protein [Frigidibacter oleivorans]|uniref:hypothetical protein n=1 Tax=Frigidibacter oleivorans TaxID=2487129 RepID=UPI000F8DFC2F|nr:hypothetical protein [Frigidibacter oleivorans]
MFVALLAKARLLAVGAVLTSMLLLLGFGLWQQRRAGALTVALRETEARVEAFEAAAQVHRAHIERLERIVSDAAAFDRDIQETEGADAPLDPRLLPAARRLWP